MECKTVSPQGYEQIVERVESTVKETLEQYRLIEPGEKVAVALSGGKDSTTVLYILHKLGYHVEGLMLDLYMGSWSKKHAENMTAFCAQYSIPLTIVDVKKDIGHGIPAVKAILKRYRNLTGCTTCGILKRWMLNRWAKEINADKLVTGHNLDDEAQNVLMNFMKGNLLLGANSSPATGGGKIKGFVQRIKPLFFVAEEDIRAYAKGKQFQILYEKCPCATGTYRVDTREWMRDFSDEEKGKIVRSFQGIISQLRHENVRTITMCEVCSEPSTTTVCNACKILAYVKK